MTDAEEVQAVAQITEAMEKAALAESAAIAQQAAEPALQAHGNLSGLPDVDVSSHVPIAIDDLRERVAILRDAWATRYRDGSLEIVFDTDARRTTAGNGLTVKF